MSKKFFLSKTPTPKPRLSDEMKKDVIYKVCVASLAFLGAFLTFNAVVSRTYVLHFFTLKNSHLFYIPFIYLIFSKLHMCKYIDSLCLY